MYKIIFHLLLFSIPLKTACQLDSFSLHRYIEKKSATGKLEEGVIRFYTANQFSPVWLSNTGATKQAELRSLTALRAENNPAKLPAQLILTGNLTTGTIEDSLMAEITFTANLLNYLRYNSGVLNKPSFRYDGLKPASPSLSVDSIAGVLLINHSVTELIGHLRPKMKEILLAGAKLQLMISRQHSVKEAKVTSTIANSQNIQLMKKLFLLGIIDTVSVLPDSLVKKAVSNAQTMFNLLNDGVLRSTFLEEMNVPVNERINRLSTALDYYQWLHTINMNEPVIVVNIPAAELTIYEADSALLRMRMIVGKPATPTPTLTSRVADVVFYPYWNVPHNIAVNEMLPSIKQTRSFIDANNLQILDKSGRILDPAKINWHNLSASNFPYHIRQSTGCDNALGILKVEFYNPFSVYLHDTPIKSLFMLNKRYFSHGCMRMEQPIDLVMRLLNNKWPAGLDTSVCLEDQKPVIIPVSVQMPVVVWYNPAGIDEQGRIIFYEDVYRKWDNQ